MITKGRPFLPRCSTRTRAFISVAVVLSPTISAGVHPTGVAGKQWRGGAVPSRQCSFSLRASPARRWRQRQHDFKAKNTICAGLVGQNVTALGNFLFCVHERPSHKIQNQQKKNQKGNHKVHLSPSAMQYKLISWFLTTHVTVIFNVHHKSMIFHFHETFWKEHHLQLFTGRLCGVGTQNEPAEKNDSKNSSFTTDRSSVSVYLSHLYLLVRPTGGVKPQPMEF